MGPVRQGKLLRDTFKPILAWWATSPHLLSKVSPKKRSSNRPAPTHQGKRCFGVLQAYQDCWPAEKKEKGCGQKNEATPENIVGGKQEDQKKCCKDLRCLIKKWSLFPDTIQGSYRSWKTRKVMEIKYFSFQVWKVMEFNCGLWKGMENYSCLLYTSPSPRDA